MRFSDWLRRSNEAADLRTAFDLFDQMPKSLAPSTKAALFDALQGEAKARWAETKAQLGLDT